VIVRDCIKIEKKIVIAFGLTKEEIIEIAIVRTGGAGGVLRTKNFVENVNVKGRVNFSHCLV
jgi:hypothetical protein